MSFAVVRFLYETQDEEEVVSEVPTSWLTKDEKFCKWPPEKFVGIYINKSYPPQEDWKEYPVVVECFCDSLKEAKLKAKGEASEKVGRGFRKIKQTDYFSPADEEERHFSRKKGTCGATAKGNNSVITASEEESSFQEYVMLINESPPGQSVASSVAPKVTPEEEIEETGETSTDQDQIISTSEDELTAPQITQVERVLSPSSTSLSGVDEIGSDVTITTGVVVPENELAIINTKLDKIIALVGNLTVDLLAIKEEVQDSQNTSIRDPAATIPFNFPLKNLSDLEICEEYINKDDGKTNFIKHLKTIGGNDAKDLTTRILKNIFSNSLGEVCSWTGRKGNYAVGNLKLMKIIFAVTHQKFKISNKEFELMVMDWLRHSKQRRLRQEAESQKK